MTGLKQKIILLDPWDIAASKLNLPVGHFNPLDWMKRHDSRCTPFSSASVVKGMSVRAKTRGFSRANLM